MSSKKAATADSDEEASQMSGEDHTQNVFSTDNSFEQNSTSNKKSASKKVSSKKRSSRRKNSASDVDDDEEESEVGSLPEDEEILSSEESSSGSDDDDDDDDDDEESSEDSSRDDDDDDWGKSSSKKKVSKKQAKSHKSSAKQTKSKVKTAKKASAKKTSVNKKQKGGENSKKRTISDVEDGEVSDNGHGSSSDASSVFNDGYDSDLIGDEEDRRKLDAMTEKEREEEIYRRTEQRDLLKKQFEMRKKLSRKQKEEARLKRHEEKKKTAKKSQKQVASSDDDHVQMRDNDEDERNDDSAAQKQAAVEIMDRRKVNESKRKNTDVSKALANLKADREKKKQQAEDQRQKLQQQQQQKKLRAEDVFSSSSDEEKPSKSKHESSQKRHSSSEFSDESSDENESEMSSDENDEDDKNSKRPIEKKEDLNKIKLSRFRIEKWCHAPFFKDVACGCFVRIGIGLNQGENIYRVAEVVEIVETAKVYSMGTTKTNKGFRLRHGREERIYRLEFVSNQPFTDDEFNRWKENMQKNNLPLPTMRQVENKGKELQSFINYRFKDEDLDHIIQEKKRFVKDTDKIADRKIALLKQREEAVQTNDPERVKEIDLLIEELNEKAIEVNTKRSGNFNLLAAINKRNRVTSNQMVEEAMRNEYARLQEAKDDPFQRRKALPTLVAAIKKNTSSQELPKSDSQEKKKEEKKPEVAKKNPLKPPIPTFEDILAPTSLQKPIDETKQNQSILNFSAKISETIITANSTHGSNSTAHSDDLFQAHNFDININLSIPMPSNQIQTPPSYGNGTGVNNLSRRSLNLDEYKKKKGLI